MTRSFLPILGIFGAALLAGCTTQTRLDYQPSVDFVPTHPAAPQIAGVVSNDHRSESPHRLATEIPTFGNPLMLFPSRGEALDTQLPVKDEVARVFGEALALRGEITHDPSAPLVLMVDLYKFDADHYMHDQARIAMAIRLMDRRTGQILYRDDIEDQIKTLQLLGSSVRDLQMMAEQVLDRSIDRLLAKPEFQALAAPLARPPNY